MFDYVVVDTGRLEDDRMQAIVGLADSVLLVTVLDVLSVRNTNKTLGFLRQAECPDENVLLLVNRSRRRCG